MSEDCDLRICDVVYHEEGSSFTLDGENYSISMVGEFNVRNAAMAVSAARFAGLSADQARDGLLSFEGVARRQELKGEVNGIKVVDDFAHHPTAIKLAIAALRQRYAGARLWVLFEPRSNTTKRSVFQKELAESLALADLAVVAAMSDLHKVPEAERLNPDRLAQDIKDFGGTGWYLPGVPEIVDLVVEKAQPGDVLAVLSNGGFGGIHQKLLDRLA
jgi:UDP-N-acetylmuramate: L-alanyl-gamma-D-glutamyl-meso-diaminopimelate ligase